MSKPAVQDDRQELPQGWDWADWSGRSEAQRFWQDELAAKQRAAFNVRFQEMINAIAIGRPQAHEKVFFFQGGGKVKITRPGAGWRAWFFRHGDTYFVTHFTRGTSKKTEDREEVTTQRACEEHKTRHPTVQSTSSKKTIKEEAHRRRRRRRE